MKFQIKIPKIIRNALIIGSISGFGCFTGIGFNLEVLWTAFVTGGLVFLIELRNNYKVKDVKTNKKGSSNTFFF